MAKGVKSSLELSARYAEVVKSAIDHWAETNAISHSQASQLANTIAVQGFDWEKFAKYTLRLAILFLVVAVSSVVFEDSFLRIYKRIVALPFWLRGSGTGAIALAVHIWAYQRSQHLPEQKYANEAIHAIGALFFALAAFQLLEQLDSSFRPSDKDDRDDGVASGEKEADSEKERERRKREFKERERLRYNILHGVMLGLATIYGAVGILAKTNFIWSCSMLVLGYVFGGLGAYAAGTYYIGTRSPVLFIGLGSFLIGGARLMRSSAITEPLWSTTRTWGLIYFFVSLWILSLTGYDDFFKKSKSNSRLARSPKLRMFLWSMLFFAAAGASVLHGLRFDDSTTKGFGLTFLGINLYTKFLEYCWGWYKPVFFALLAGSFAVIGKYAENIWNLHTTR